MLAPSQANGRLFGLSLLNVFKNSQSISLYEYTRIKKSLIKVRQGKIVQLRGIISFLKGWTLLGEGLLTRL